MIYNIDYTNTAVIYHHSTVITKVMLLYNTEWQYDHGMAVNYWGKKFYNIGPWWQANGIGMSQCQKVNKAEDLADLSTNITRALISVTAY